MRSQQLDMRRIARRTFLGHSTLGMGSVALAGMLSRAQAAAADSDVRGVGASFRGIVSPTHIAPKAKRVIFLCMAGGPSQLETLDPKPKLVQMHGQAIPESFTKGQPVAQIQSYKQMFCFGPQVQFRQYGQSGQWISDLLPHIAGMSDDICIVRSLQTEQINHDPAHTYMNTGTSISGRPSMGAWINYGLGSECDDLPGFVVLISRAGPSDAQPVSSRQWHSGFLPGKYQGVRLNSQGDPVYYVGNPPGFDRQRQQEVIDAVAKIDRLRESHLHLPEVAAQIAQYELAFRMQMSVPELVDIASEPKHVLDTYGVTGLDGSYAANCLLARRLAERGVRFIQIYHRDWDHHNTLKTHLSEMCRSADRPTAALLNDLKQRGMLDDTLVVWGGEFGRTPMAQGDVNSQVAGRDHHIRGFSMFLAGGGIKPGINYGSTDELGYHAVQDVVHVHDLHATMLYLMGIDHQRLTYRYQGRDFRLTDVAGKVVHDIVV